jgi:hypothetical protein
MAKDPNVLFRSANEIAPGLWLGNQAASQDLDFLKQIDVVINCTKHIPFAEIPRLIKIRIPINDPGPPVDSPTYEGNLNQYSPKDDQIILLQVLDYIVATIAKMRSKNKRVLIHCHAGAQRSAAVMAAYLVKHATWAEPIVAGISPVQKRRAKFASVVSYIVKKRPVAFYGGKEMSFRPALVRYFDLRSSYA